MGRGLLRGALGLVALTALLGLVGAHWQAELVALTGAVYAALGLPALVALLFVTDAVVSPVPPQAVLVVIAHSPLHEQWLPLISGLALLSSVAGITGWSLATRLGHTRFAHVMLGRFRHENRALITRWGALGAVVCALSPIPYSVCCWAAGTLHVPLRTFVWIPVLRAPRFFLYYVAIAFADELWRALRDWP